VCWLPHGDAFGTPGALARLRENPLRAWGALAFVRAARRELAELPAGTRIVAHWIVPGALPIAWAAPRDAELEVVVHGTDARLLLAAPRWIRRTALAALLRRGAHFRCVSAELALALGADVPEFASRAEVRPCAIEVPTIDHGDARRDLGVSSHTRLVVLVSRLVRGKRVATALRAAALIPRAELVVIGDGPERAALAAEFPAARFEGALPRIKALTWMAAADLVLSASREEGAPTIVREARALGTPVVATRAGDLELWAAQDSGLSVVR
jgi:glycosyltransferase involved in cell wall biosynthesis